MKKGDIVLVTKSVFTKHRVSAQFENGNVEILRKGISKDRIAKQYARPFQRLTHKKPFEGLVVGWSMRISGGYTPGRTNHSFEDYNDYSAGELYNTKHHKVIMVQPLHNERWNHPIPCLEEDLINISTMQDILDHIKKAHKKVDKIRSNE